MKRKSLLILSLFFIFIFTISIVMTVKLFNQKGNIAVIYVDGEEYDRINLSKVTKSYNISLLHNDILVEHGQISMVKSDCLNKLCIKQGKKNGGIPIICLPNKVCIVFENDEGVDALSW